MGAKSAALFASRMSNERSADELRPQTNGLPAVAGTLMSQLPAFARRAMPGSLALPPGGRRRLERVKGVAPSSWSWQSRILLLNHTRKRWCPQPGSHRQPDAQDAPALCFKPWGRKLKPLTGLFHRLNHLSRRPLELLRVQGFENGTRVR